VLESKSKIFKEI